MVVKSDKRMVMVTIFVLVADSLEDVNLRSLENHELGRERRIEIFSQIPSDLDAFWIEVYKLLMDLIFFFLTLSYSFTYAFHTSSPSS